MLSQRAVSGFKLLGIGSLATLSLSGLMVGSFLAMMMWLPFPWALKVLNVATLDVFRIFYSQSYSVLIPLVVASSASMLGLSVWLGKRLHASPKRIAYTMVSVFIVALMVASIAIPSTMAISATQTAEYNQFNNKPCTYYVFTDGTNYYAQNCTTGSITYGGPTNAGGATGTSISSVFNSITTSGTIAFSAGTFTPTATLTISSNQRIEMEQGTIIAGRSLSANVFTASSIKNFTLTGGYITMKSSQNAVYVNNANDFDIEPYLLSGMGQGIVVAGTSSVGTISATAINLGSGDNAGNPASSEPVYLNPTVSVITVTKVINNGTTGHGTGNANTWCGGVYAGKDIVIGQISVRNCAGGGAELGGSLTGAKSHRVSLAGITCDVLNTDCLDIQNIENVNFGYVNVYKAGWYNASSLQQEPGVSIYGNYQNVTGGQIIASFGQAEGVLFTISDAHNVGPVSISSIMASDNCQGTCNTGLQAGVGITANQNGNTMSGITIGQIWAQDTQAAATQLYGLNFGSVAGSTLLNLYVSQLLGTGNKNALIKNGCNGTCTNIFVGPLVVANAIASYTTPKHTLISYAISNYVDTVEAFSVCPTGQVTAYTSGTIHYQLNYTDGFANAQTISFFSATGTGVQNLNCVSFMPGKGTTITIVITGTTFVGTVYVSAKLEIVSAQW